MREHVAIALSVLCAVHAGCALERIGVVPSGARPDAARGDGGPIGTSRPDAGPEAHDGGPPAFDAGPPDAGREPLCTTDPALVACYPFDGDARDHGPRGNDLVVSGVSWDPTGGMVLGAPSSASIAQRPELSHGETTILAWARVDVIPPNGRAAILDRDGQYGIFVYPGGELRCAISIAGSDWATAASAIEVGRWHHVACAAEGSTLRLYVDGREVATASAATTRTPGSSPLHVGENAPDGADQLIGAIDDLRIWEAPWGAQRIAEDASRGR